MIGTTLEGKYRIDRLLGSGGMGAVYAAEDVETGRKVAIKVIHAHLASGVRGFIERFEREAQAASSIDTEHIARSFAVGTDPVTGNHYMVLEYLVGEDLQQALKRLGPLAPELALRIVAEACLGLEKAHEAGIIHRDIKPANLFLAKAGDARRIVKVLDFGVAKVRKDVADTQSETAGLTRTGSILGSPLYMSPEQARSVKYIDHRSDIWSLGVVLYQTLAGRTPYEHIAGLGDLILALCSEHPPPVQQFAPWIGPEVASVVDYALRIDPNQRFQSARELHDALRPLIHGDPEIYDDMIVALDDETHDHIAPTYFRGIKTSPTAHVQNLQRATAATALAEAPVGSTSEATPPPRAAQGSSTGSGLSGETTGPGGAARRPSMLPTVAIALGCVLAGGAGVYAFTRPGAQPAAPVPTLAAPPASALPPASAAPPVASSAEGPVVTPAPPASASAAVETPSASASVAPAPAGTWPGKLAHPKPTAAPSAKGIPLDSRSYGDRK